MSGTARQCQANRIVPDRRRAQRLQAILLYEKIRRRQVDRDTVDRALLRLRRRLHAGLNNRLRLFTGLSRFCRPVSAVFLLTERCNARCLHCDIWKNQGKEDSPRLEDWKQVLRDLRRWLGPVQIVFTGGEVFLYPHAVELVGYAISLGFCVEVLTNGYWTDQSRIERLALTNPWRITVSLDGIGAAHSKIRGREDFFEKTSRTLDTLSRVRIDHGLAFRIQLKTVIMEHNLDDLVEVARFATRNGMEVFYQPIEQNYNTPRNPLWFQSGGNWPRDPQQAAGKVRELVALKKSGLPIANTERHFDAMVRYFQDPLGLGLLTQAQVAQERKPVCCALTMLQFQANGDVTVCANRPPIGNIRQTPIRLLWKQRSRVWENGCCLEETAPAVREQTSDQTAAAGGSR